MFNTIKARFANNRRRRQLRDQVRRLQQTGSPVKVVIGAGNIDVAGWLLTDLPVLDILNEQHWRAIFPEPSINRVLAEHVLEHLTLAQLQHFLGIIPPFLASDHLIRIAVPDGCHPSPAYIDAVRPGGSGAGADDHKVLYTADILEAHLHEAGYAVRLLEYFDVDGAFHQQEWDAADGPVRRSAANDIRNQAQPLAYTSLIVDCWLAQK